MPHLYSYGAQRLKTQSSYYSRSGDVTIGIEQTRAGDDQIVHTVGNVAVGTPFTYVLGYEKGVLSVSVNGRTTTALPTYELGAPRSFFKVGNYNQGRSASSVHFFGIDIEHHSPADGGMHADQFPLGSPRLS